MRFLVLPVMLLSLALAGCGTIKSVLQGGTSVFTSVTNPVSRTNLAEVESAYGVLLTAAVAYRNACAQKLIAATCRPAVVQLQFANRKAHGAIIAARNFVKNNPTLSALSLIGIAGQAVSDFQSVAYVNGVK